MILGVRRLIQVWILDERFVSELTQPHIGDSIHYVCIHYNATCKSWPFTRNVRKLVPTSLVH